MGGSLGPVGRVSFAIGQFGVVLDPQWWGLVVVRLQGRVASIGLVALEWLYMRVWVDRAPWADMVVVLGVLGVEDFKDGAGGVVRWSWTDMPGLAWVDGAWRRWVVGLSEDGLEVRAKGRW